MSTEYRLRRVLPSSRMAVIMPVDHCLFFDRIDGLWTSSAPFLASGSNPMPFPQQLRLRLV
jgi:fructose-bisphosphate aldolase, class I